MQAFVAWVTAHRFRIVLLTVAGVPLVPAASTAFMVLEAARGGIAFAMPVALASIVGVVGLGVIAELTGFLGDGDGYWLGGTGLVAIVAGVAMGCLLRWAGRLALAFQATILAFFAIVIAFAFLGPAPELLFGEVIDAMIEALSGQSGLAADAEAIRLYAPFFLGLYEAVVLTQLIGALLLGYWWLSFLGIGQFGPEFRALKLGRVLGIPALVVMSLGLALKASLVQNLTPLVLMCFLFQGLAVMHAWAHARQWRPAAVGVVYVLMLMPATGNALLVVAGAGVLLALCTMGIIDNVFDTRAPLKGQV